VIRASLLGTRETITVKSEATGLVLSLPASSQAETDQVVVLELAPR
jgi:hypothetical protein